MRIVLASKSPRRREILSNLGVDFDIVVADCDERVDMCEPCSYVSEIAAKKGRAAKAAISDAADTLIIACDTLVLAGGEFLGKPKDHADAHRMLSVLSGSMHEVISGLYLSYNGKEVKKAMVTKVFFDEMSDAEIDNYINTNEVFDKAGAYAIQGKASFFIKGFEGDYFNVVGLPVNLLYKTLKEEFSIDLADPAK